MQLKPKLICNYDLSPLANCNDYISIKYFFTEALIIVIINSILILVLFFKYCVYTKTFIL